ncbi:MAG: signal peptidase I [Candidatus Bathyarchaeota archaeon]|nr:signal peptidase I [Candidatus Bathyarchaeota archaeon]
MASRLKPREVLKNDSVKTIIFLGVMILCVFGFWFGLKVVLKTEYPLLAVATGSMEPTLNVGDLIIVQGELNGPYDEIDVGRNNGAIIVFQSGALGKSGGELIVHRAINKEYNNGVWSFITWGDANDGPDPEWSEKYLVGKVVGRIPLVGHIPLFVREPYGIIIIVAFMLVLIFAEFLPIWRRKTQPDEDASLPENIPQRTHN